MAQLANYEDDKGVRILRCLAARLHHLSCAGNIQLFLQNFVDQYADEEGDGQQPKYMRMLVGPHRHEYFERVLNFLSLGAARNREPPAQDPADRLAGCGNGELVTKSEPCSL